MTTQAKAPESLLHVPVLNRSVRRLAFGCEPLGGFNWGEVDIEAVELAIEAALDAAPQCGPMLFDTADTYGPHLSEERLGRCLAGRRGDAVLATKFGVRLDEGRAWYDSSANYADQALDASLTRLGTDRIDLYQLHWPDKVTPLGETLAALERFRAEGRIEAYGVTNIAPAALAPHVADCPGLASFSLEYSLLERSTEAGIMDLCARGLVFIPYGCLAQGLLSGKYGADAVFTSQDRRNNPKYRNFHGDRLARNLGIVDVLKTEASRLACPVPALAIGFILSRLPHAAALAGIKSPGQLAQNLAALGVVPDARALASLESVS